MRYPAFVESRGHDDLQARAGLCANCTHARRVESARGSFFVLCELSAADTAFPRYPRLPVLQCRGFTPKSAPEE